MSDVDTGVRAAGEPRMTDPRAVRVSLAPGSPVDLRPVVVEPPEIPVAPAPRVGGTGVGGGAAEPAPALAGRTDAGFVLVDGEPAGARLTMLDGVRGRLEMPVEVRDPPEPGVHHLLLGDPAGGTETGAVEREVVIDGWRVLVRVESERLASLRERASRADDATQRGGQMEIRAIIPGQVLSVSAVSGDAVTAGQQLLVVEAMKMQNELRAPRDGTIERVAVEAGATIEVGDLLVVLA